MSPWWSRPTADDAPDDDELEDEPWSDEEEEDASGADDAEAEDDGEEDDRSPRRRRRRRRRTARTDSAEDETGDEDEDEADEPEDDEETPRRTRRRRRRRRTDRSAPSDSAGEAEDEDEPDEEEAEPDTGDSGSRRRRRRRASRSDRDDEPSSGRSKPSSPKPSAKSTETRSRKSLEFDASPEEIDQISEQISEQINQETVYSVPERNQSVNEDERKIALFCDLENIALGVRDSKEVNKFDINLVLERLLEKGKIIVKKAYCDWERYNEYKRPFHEAAIELIDIPQKYYSGKNSADIKMVVDAMDMSYAKEHLDTFVMLSGDSDFSPLVSKLKENNKYVIGIGVKGASSNLLIANCDEFIFYEDIWRNIQEGPKLEGLSKKQTEAFGLLVDAIQALVRENKDVLWGSMVKQTMQRKKPSFNESYFGYSTFSDLLEDAQEQDIIKIKKDQRSGSYIVTGFANPKRPNTRRS